ncbi:MAG: hypothetical protein J3K34DRAFT_33615 [Monoraphidium minutum]|nr:MAG: hypothetical protein J3K34DRAFT_33615 [Monoraphidium minutum]
MGRRRGLQPGLLNRTRRHRLYLGSAVRRRRLGRSLRRRPRPRRGRPLRPRQRRRPSLWEWRQQRRRRQRVARRWRPRAGRRRRRPPGRRQQQQVAAGLRSRRRRRLHAAADGDLSTWIDTCRMTARVAQPHHHPGILHLSPKLTPFSGGGCTLARAQRLQNRRPRAAPAAGPAAGALE